MALLTEYARLAESIGVESLVQGVDLALLPTSREHLKEIIAKATFSAWAGIVLKPDEGGSRDAGRGAPAGAGSECYRSCR